MLRKRSRDEAPFVVPQIFVDYGSRRTSYASASDHMMLGALALDLRRSSGSSAGSRRTSLASDSDRPLMMTLEAYPGVTSVSTSLLLWSPISVVSL
ncbi:hypothetical protein PoB_003673200 [Plakobranchus ocellatus]|uniref:Uncharacterized protein n=1 Tax=Plakobranchus ocellatus TaxID=259542 RepID=A0AAV4ATD4_9GAST|nr:hypothetical protein PoB_003673200 [Plakobranchus ocellatus]